MSIPSGFVKVRIKIDTKGNYHREILREGGSTCKSNDNQTLLEDIFDAEIEGFSGSGIELNDSGKTKEFYEQNRLNVKPRNNKGHEEAPIMTPGGNEKRKLDMGYGV